MTVKQNQKGQACGKGYSALRPWDVTCWSCESVVLIALENPRCWRWQEFETPTRAICLEGVICYRQPPGSKTGRKKPSNHFNTTPTSSIFEVYPAGFLNWVGAEFLHYDPVFLFWNDNVYSVPCWKHVTYTLISQALQIKIFFWISENTSTLDIKLMLKLKAYGDFEFSLKALERTEVIQMRMVS